ncbi:oligosaccharide flippase family protein [Cognatishimia sp.]
MNTTGGLRGKVSGLLTGSGLGARAMRSSALTVGSYGTQQALRLASNLILTRLLFPEAFGMMALVYMVIQGLNMFSDAGVTPAIMQSKRGDDPAFLNTAWTLQVGRGVLLWLCTFALAWPLAQFYDAPQLAQILPVLGLTLILSGLFPTRKDTANRHLIMGRVTLLELLGQTFGIVVAVVLAWLMGSIWALVISGLATSVAHLLLYTVYLPGDHNRFGWDKSAVAELINFGRWIFLSTIAGFFLYQGDKIILGKFLSIDMLGIYNIGFFLASFPFLLGNLAIQKVLIPIYRERPPQQSPQNFAKLRKMRFLVSAALLSMSAVLALTGNWLIDFLYDSRYMLSGGVLLFVAVSQIPHLILLTYDQAALAAGDSRRFFVLNAARAVLMIAGLWGGVLVAGLFGALVGATLAGVLVYPVVAWLARHQGTWDPLHDGVFGALGLVLAVFAFWVNWPAITALVALNSP